LDKYLLSCAITLTFYDHLLTLDDEVRRYAQLIIVHCRLLTPLPQRFGIFGRLVNHGVTSVIRSVCTRKLNISRDSFRNLHHSRSLRISSFRKSLMGSVTLSVIDSHHPPHLPTLRIHHLTSYNSPVSLKPYGKPFQVFCF